MSSGLKSTNGVIMRQHKINNEFISYNESLRKSRPAQQQRSNDIYVGPVPELILIEKRTSGNLLSVKVSRTQFGESEVNLLAMLI